MGQIAALETQKRGENYAVTQNKVESVIVAGPEENDNDRSPESGASQTEEIRVD
jgi:hypothetical protein